MDEVSADAPDENLWQMAGRLAGPMAVLAPTLLAGGVAVIFHQAPDRTTALIALLVAATAWLTLQLTERPELSLVAGTTLAAWPLIYQAPQQILLLALIPGGLMLLPAGVLGPAPRLAGANLAGLTAGAATYYLTSSPTGTLLALIGAGALAWVRPDHPTTEVIRGMRSISLLLPSVALVALLAANAATERFTPVSVLAGLKAGLTLFALAWSVALAGLGLVTLVESDTPAQRMHWVASAAAAGAWVGMLVLKDPSLVLAATPLAATPLSLLGAVAVGRAKAAGPAVARWAFLAVPVILASAQTGWV
ncbi:MAG: hypothetical protein R3185_03200 [Candidatus Thermoplasmatota archaeon]|nr:hypothetical protein [Candidatus Thermoplasmatota archaeon]